VALRGHGPQWRARARRGMAGARPTPPGGRGDLRAPAPPGTPQPRLARRGPWVSGAHAARGLLVKVENGGRGGPGAHSRTPRARGLRLPAPRAGAHTYNRRRRAPRA